MGDYASQDDFDSLKEQTSDDIGGLKEQIITLMDNLKDETEKVDALNRTIEELAKTIDDLKSSASDLRAKLDKVNQDLYESPQFISSLEPLDSGVASKTGILTEQNIVASPSLLMLILAQTSHRS